jgi:hypothetical protein
LAEIADTEHELGVVNLRQHTLVLAELHLNRSLRLKQSLLGAGGIDSVGRVSIDNGDTTIGSTLHQLAIVATSSNRWVFFIILIYLKCT